MKVIQGDLIELALNCEFDVIVHGCNRRGVMGSGIARQIKETFPGAYKIYKDNIDDWENKLPLGDYTVYIYRNFVLKGDKCLLHNLLIVNALTQETFGREKVQVDYDAVRKVMKNLYNDFKGSDKRIGYPKIGAGLGGGDWNIISKIIDEELEGLDHTLVIYNK